MHTYFILIDIAVQDLAQQNMLRVAGKMFMFTENDNTSLPRKRGAKYLAASIGRITSKILKRLSTKWRSQVLASTQKLSLQRAKGAAASDAHDKAMHLQKL